MIIWVVKFHSEDTKLARVLDGLEDVPGGGPGGCKEIL